jgi:E3 ubiquitin-protein ligase synoviolin
MFGFLLFVKCFHWLLADRVEWVCSARSCWLTLSHSPSQMDQRPYPGPTPLFHIRALSLFALLGMTDAIMLAFTVESTLRYGVGATVLFSNEVRVSSLLV